MQKIALILLSAIALCSFTTGHAQTTTTSTNTIQGGGTISSGDTAVITDPVTSVTGAITNNGLLRFTQSGSLTDAFAISGSGSVTMAGTGMTYLSVNNSYSGGTLVSQGALVGGASTSFGSGSIVLGDGNTGTNDILLMADTTESTTIANNITVANLGTGLVSIGGTNTGASSANAWTGTLTLNRNVQVFSDTPHSGGRTSFIGQITGSGGITVTQGRGRVTLQNTTNDFTGPVVIDSGATLQLDVANGINEVIPNSAAVTVNGALNFASGGGTETIGSLAGSGTVSSVVAGTYRLVIGGSTNTTFGGAINNGSGVVGLTKSGTGTLLLTGANGFTGGVTLNGGTLGAGSANAIGSSGAISFGGGTLQYSASNTTDYSSRFSNAASQQYSIDTNGENVTLASNLTSSGGSFTKLGAGAVTLSGNNSYSAGTLVSQGALVGGASTSFGSGAIVLGDGNTGTNDILLMADTTESTTIANNITVANLGTGLVSIGGTNTGASSANAWTGTLTLNRNVQLFGDTTPGSSGRTSFLGQITGSGGITVTQGRVTLQNGTNNFTGPVVVNSGATLQLDVGGGLNEVIPNSAAVTVNGLLNFASGGGTETIGSLDGSGTVSSFVAGSYSLVVGGSTSTTFSGVINNGSGVIGLTKSGTGTLTLAGPNSYSGGTIVSAGQLVGTTASLQGAITNNASVAFDQATTGNYSSVMSGSGSLTKLGAGTVKITGSNSYSGGTTVTSGTVELSAGVSFGGSAAGLGTGAVSIASGAQVTYWLSMSTSNTIANAFSLSGGTLHSEDGSNNFTGLFTLASGASTISSRYEDTIRLSGGLTGSGDVLFTQAGGLGTGPTFVLSGTGSNTGTVRVSGSANGIATKLQLANVNALQSATLDMATGDLGTVEFTVAGNNTYSLGGLQGARNLAVGSNSLSVGGNNQSTTYSGDLSASGLFTKVGSGALTLSGSNSAAAGVAVNAGTLGLGSANAIGSTGTISFGGGYLQFSASNTTDYSARFSNAANQQYRIDTNGQTVTLASALASSSGSLTKNGVGTLILTATSGFTGATAVDGGRLLVNGQLGNTAVAVNASGMLGGSGTILGDVTINSSGTLSPGNSPGVLTVGSLSLSDGSTTLMEITGTAAGLYDQIVGTGTGSLTYGGNLDLVMSGSYADGTTFHLFSNFSSPSIGDFAAVGLDATGEYAGLTFSDSDHVGGIWTSSWTTNHQRLVFSTGTGDLVVVPEPSTYAMALAGLACGGWQMWRRRRLRQAPTLAA